MSTVDIYQDKTGDYRWRVVAANGEIVATGEGYTTEQDAERGFRDAARNITDIPTFDDAA
jgi:uncharacterized protein